MAFPRLRAGTPRTSRRGDGSITFTSPAGAVLFTVGVPVMYDAEGIASSDISVSMTQDKKTVVTTRHTQVTLDNLIRHELSHNLGTTDCENSCCFMENNTLSSYCSECDSAIKNNYINGG